MIEYSLNYIEEVLTYISKRSFIELIFMFWPFFFFDLPRFLILDFVCLTFFVLKRKKEKIKWLSAKYMLYREKPLISIIAPGRNEGKNIYKLASSLRNQTYKNIEIIVVDDGSDDDTPQILEYLEKKGLIDKFFRCEVRGGKASAANLALRYAKGKFIVHLDADSHLKEDAIEKIVLPFYMDRNIGAVNGDIRVRNIDSNIITNLQAIEYIKSISTGRIVSSTLGILRIVSGAFGAFRKDILERIKGWDVGPGLDGDITIRIRKLGFKVVHQPDSICYTSVPTSITKLAKQRYRWNRSLVRFRIRRHRDLLSPFNKNFKVLNTLSILDNLFFNMILNFKWWIYLFQIILVYKSNVIFILSINYILYLIMNVLEYSIAITVLGKTFRKKEFTLWLYIPLMPLYTGFFLRTIRTFAHIMELIFKASYYDKWNPWKVSKLAKQEDIR